MSSDMSFLGFKLRDISDNIIYIHGTLCYSHVEQEF
jgi:hypothetical protein